MTREEFIKKFPVGSKVRLDGWTPDDFWEVLFHGKDMFFAKGSTGGEAAMLYLSEWLPCEEPKKGFELWDVVRWNELAYHTRSNGIVVEHDIMKGVTKAFFPDEMRVETYYHSANGDPIPLEKVEGKIAMAPASFDSLYAEDEKFMRGITGVITIKEYDSVFSNYKNARWPHSISSLTIEDLK